MVVIMAVITEIMAVITVTVAVIMAVIKGIVAVIKGKVDRTKMNQSTAPIPINCNLYVQELLRIRGCCCGHHSYDVRNWYC